MYMNIYNAKIVLLGMNELGKKCLLKLILSKFNIIQVIVPKENRLKSIEKVCKKQGINYYQIKDSFEELKKIIFSTKIDLLIVASFPQLIPENIIKYPAFGSINVHPSILPKFRGSHPINWALIKDETVTGVTIHFLDKGMDTGDIITQISTPITNFDTVNTIKDKLFTLAADLLVDSVKKIIKLNGKVERIKQNHQNRSFAPKRKPKDGIIDWSKDSREIFNLIRASKYPYSSYSYSSDGEKVEFQKSFLTKKTGKVLGKINGYYIITTGDGCVMLKTKSKLQIGDILIKNKKHY